MTASAVVHARQWPAGGSTMHNSLPSGSARICHLKPNSAIGSSVMRTPPAARIRSTSGPSSRVRRSRCRRAGVARRGRRAVGLRSLVSRRCGEHAGWVVAGPGSREARREMIRQRLGTVRARIQELRALRADGAGQAAPDERHAARQRAAASRAAAERAAAACAQAFRFSAEAHERAALQHERAVAAGCGRAGEHGRLAADHRSAAVEDLRQAERVQSRLGRESR